MALFRKDLLQAAEKLVAKGKIEAAIREYKKVLERSPGDTNTLNRIGDLFVRLRKGDEAVRYYLQTAEQYALDGFYVKAIAVYKKIQRIEPGEVEVHRRLAELYRAQGLTTDARIHYGQLADHFLRGGDVSGAITTYLKMVELEPDNPSLQLRLAELFRDNNDPRNAVAAYGRVAESMIQHGQIDHALQAYERALRVDCSDLDFVSEALRLIKDSGGEAKAERLLDLARSLNPRAEDLRVLLRPPSVSPDRLVGTIQAPAPPSRARPVPLPVRPAVQPAARQEDLTAAIEASFRDLGLDDRRSPLPIEEPAFLEEFGAEEAPGRRGSLEPVDEPTRTSRSAESAARLADSGTRPAASIEPRVSPAGDEARQSGAREVAATSAGAVERPAKLEESSARQPGSPESKAAAEDLFPDELSLPEPSLLPTAARQPPSPVVDLEEEFEIDLEGLGAEVPEAAIQEAEALWSDEPEGDEAPAGHKEAISDWLAGSEGATEAEQPSEIGSPFEFTEEEAPEASAPTSPEPAEMLPLIRGPREPAPVDDAVLRERLDEARVFAKYGLLAKAVERLAEVLDVDPQHHEARALEVKVLVEQGEHELAARSARRLLVTPDATASWKEVETILLDAGYRVETDFVEPPSNQPSTEQQPVEREEQVPALAVPHSPMSAVIEGEPNTNLLLEEEVELVLEEWEPDVEPLTASEPRAEVSATTPDWLAAEEGEPAFEQENEFVDLAAELAAALSDFPVEERRPEEQSLEEIVEGFKRGVSENIREEDADTHYNLGIAYREMMLTDEAISEFQVSSKDERYHVSSCAMLGLCFREKGLPDLAAKWYRRALESEGVKAEQRLSLLYDVGDSCEDAGAADEARAAFFEIESSSAGYRDVAERLARLRGA